MAITRTQIAKQLLAQGGRTGFQGGGADMGAEDRAQERADRGYGDTSGPVDMAKGEQNVVQYLATEGFSPKQIDKTIKGPNIFDKIKRSRFNNPTTRAIGRFGLYTLNPTLIGGLDARKAIQLKDILDETEESVEDQIIGRAGLAEGGMPYEGGIMDFESARQMYGLGKLVKKVTRTVKKIAKSPVGKAALLYTGAAGIAGLGSGTTFMSNLTSPTSLFGNLKTTFGKGSFNPFLRRVGADRDPVFSPLGEFANKLGIVGKSGLPSITTAITATSALAGLLTPEQEEEAQTLADSTGIDIEQARNSILAARRDDYKMDFRARGFKAEGGIMKEPVAKKTMPLLDMDGKEMDLRAEGGFVPIGRMEKADDVPARLSKNEFVFTADAVRNAGEGNVDKGAEVMYNMMKNLESGGEVSEESQGLEGARKMFQTSQRLEEVL